jgi:hypothetical protein
VIETPSGRETMGVLVGADGDSEPGTHPEITTVQNIIIRRRMPRFVFT